jgi:hypothetical protein
VCQFGRSKSRLFGNPGSPGAYQLDRPCTDANVPDEYLTLNGAHISTTVTFSAANLESVDTSRARSRAAMRSPSSRRQSRPRQAELPDDHIQCLGADQPRRHYDVTTDHAIRPNNSDGLRSCATPHSRLFPDFGVGPLSFYTSPFNQSWKPRDEPKSDVSFRLRHGIGGASVLANLQPAVRRWQDARAPQRH